MIWVDSPYPAGTVAIVMGELGRFTAFEMSLDQLQVPRGTALVRLQGPSVARNRNEVVAKHLRGEWVCFFDDDQVIPGDTLMKLLSHDLPIVGALYSTKRPPFYPLAFDNFDDAQRKFIPYSWTEMFSGPRLRQVAAAGTGGMLIRKTVTDAIEAPWFHWGEFSDDMFFCLKAGAAGFPIHVDAQAPIGHTTTINIWPGSQQAGALLQLDWLKLQLADDSPRAAASRIVIPGR